MESSGRTRVTHETKDHLGECSAVFFSPLHLVEFKFRASWGSWWKNDRKNSGGKWDPRESLCIYPRADHSCSLNTQRLFHQKGTAETAGGRQVIRGPFQKLSNSHGPDIDFGAVFLPGKEFGSGVGRTATLRAEWVGMAQDPRTVAQTKVCKRRTKPARN